MIICTAIHIHLQQSAGTCLPKYPALAEEQTNLTDKRITIIRTNAAKRISNNTHYTNCLRFYILSLIHSSHTECIALINHYSFSTLQHHRMVELYGGAISSELPADAIDVSTFRQIPDTQEVFLLEKPTGLDQSLIFDLLESVDAQSLAEVVAVHLEDILEEPATLVAPLELFTNENLACESHSYLVKPGPSKLESDNAKVYMLLVIHRVEKVNTDIVMSMNVPVESGEVTAEVFNKEAENAIGGTSVVGEAYSVIRKAAVTLKVEDWALFA